MHYCDNFLILSVSNFGHSVNRIRLSESWSFYRLHHCLIILNSVVPPLVVLNDLVKVVIELLLVFRLAQKLLWDKVAVCKSLFLVICHLLHAMVLDNNIERF